jgi:hypothetical protein
MRQGRSEAEGFNPLSDCGTIELIEPSICLYEIYFLICRDTAVPCPGAIGYQMKVKSAAVILLAAPPFTTAIISPVGAN